MDSAHQTPQQRRDKLALELLSALEPVSHRNPRPVAVERDSYFVHIDGCKHNGTCLHVAGLHDWPQYSCHRCGIFEKALAEMIDMLAGDSKPQNPEHQVDMECLQAELALARQTIRELEDALMGQSKIDQLKGEAAKVAKAAISNGSTAKQLQTKLKEYGVEISYTPVWKWLEKQRKGKKKSAPVEKFCADEKSCVECGFVECVCDEEDEVVALVEATPVGQVIEHGYVVLPTGAIWTPNVEDAIDLSKRIRSE